MRVERWRGNTSLLATVAGAQVRAGDWDGAYREVTRNRGSSRKDDSFLKTDILVEMAEAQIFLGDLYGAVSTIRHGLLLLNEHAFFFFSPLCRIAKMRENIADEITANEALDLAERTSADQLAKEKAQGFTRSTCAGNVHWLTWLAEAQAAGGRKDKADHSLQSALDLISSGRYDLVGRQEVLDHGHCEIVNVQARIGDIPGALKTLERMSERGRLIGMRNIAVALADGGDLSGAFAFVARIEKAEPKTRALAWIADIQMRRDDYVGVKNTLAQIELSAAEPKTQALVWIADIQARLGDSMGAKSTLGRIQLSADGSARPECAEGLLSIAKAEIQRGDRESARRTLAESLHIVDEAQLSTWPISELYADVSEAYAAAGMVEEAQRIFERVPYNEDTFASRNSLVRMIAKAQTVAGNVAVAEAWVQTLPSASEQCFAWLGIVDGLVSLSSEV
jgi:tetratricopeptide (TPR) repeat protein